MVLCPNNAEHFFYREAYGYVIGAETEQEVCADCYDAHKESRVFHSPHGGIMITKYFADDMDLRYADWVANQKK